MWKPPDVFMSSIYVRLSKPLEASKADLLARIARLAGDRGIPAFLLGATARDVLFEHAYGVPIVRRTMDVDVSVQMPTWDDYHSFCETLREAGFTNPHPGHVEKFKDPVTGLEMDMLPYGEIADDSQAIVWPSDNSRWSVIGLEDAFRSALLLPLVAADGGARSSMAYWPPGLASSAASSRAPAPPWAPFCAA